MKLSLILLLVSAIYAAPTAATMALVADGTNCKHVICITYGTAIANGDEVRALVTNTASAGVVA